LEASFHPITLRKKLNKNAQDFYKTSMREKMKINGKLYNIQG
jgi:hypothetical protein